MMQKSPDRVCSPRADRHTTYGLRKAVQLTGVVVLAMIMFGCSISKSISDSASSPFDSSSDSSKSSSQGKEAAYQSDVRDYTEAYVRSSGDIKAFKAGLTSIASKHGITNWEADQATYTGIGEGLGKAQATDAQLEVYKANIAQGDAAKASAIQKGCDAFRKAKKD